MDIIPEELSPITKAWHEAFGGYHTQVALKSHAVPIVLCIVFWQLYQQFLRDYEDWLRQQQALRPVVLTPCAPRRSSSGRW